HFTEEMAHAQSHPFVRQLDLYLAGGDEIHRVAGFAAAHDDSARLGLLRPQEPHDVGDLVGGELGEQGHPPDHSPGHDKVAAMNFLRKSIGDDANGQRHHDQTEEYGHGGNHFAPGGNPPHG